MRYPHNPERTALQDRVRALLPGQSFLLPLARSAADYEQRWRSIASAAHAVFGPGYVRLRTKAEGVLVQRLVVVAR